MSNLSNAVCFTCGLVIETPPRLSRLTNGQVCPACRERVLAELPPALPSKPAVESEAEPATLRNESESESDEDDEPESGPGGWKRDA